MRSFVRAMIVAKYRFSASHLQPFIEAGPVFRKTGNLNANPSHAGIAAGAGFGIRLSQFTIAPTGRYTPLAAGFCPYGAHRLSPDALNFEVQDPDCPTSGLEKSCWRGSD